MVRKKDREKDLTMEATYSFENKIGTMCYGKFVDDQFFVLNPEKTKWVSMPRWVFNYYFSEEQIG